jgi:hypothetical protein
VSAKGTYLKRELLESAAFRSLRTVAAMRVFLAIRLRGRPKTVKDRKGVETTVWQNNGEIMFKYTDAENELGLKKSAFRSAIRTLSAVGLIDYKSGGGVRGIPSLFSISERWRSYGTDAYQSPKLSQKPSRGFKKGNQLGRNSGQAKFVLSVTGQHKPPASMLSQQHKPSGDDGGLCCSGNMVNRADFEVNQ